MPAGLQAPFAGALCRETNVEFDAPAPEAARAERQEDNTNVESDEPAPEAARAEPQEDNTNV